MILNCKSYHQPSPPISIPKHTNHFPIARNVTDTSESNTPKQQGLQTYTDQRKGNAHPQNCNFKIRTFSTKMGHRRNSIQGKQLKNVLVIEGNKKIKMQFKEQENVNKCVEKQKVTRNYMVRPKKQHKNQTVFNSISIVKTNEKKSIAFQRQDNSFLKPLSYRPTIKWNQNEINNTKNITEVVVVVSLRCFNREAAKYWKNFEKGFYSQKSVEVSGNQFSLQTMNLLRTLSGQSNKESWLNHCNFYYKVENERQMNAVYDFLTENNLPKFTGIINCQKRTSESCNIYSLQHILHKESHLILIEDYDSLQYQLPLLQYQNFICICSKMTNSANLYPFINCLKEANLEYVSKKNPTFQRSFIYDSQKQNINNNAICIVIQKSSSKLTKNKDLEKLASSPQIVLQISLSLQLGYLHLQTNRLMQIAKQALKSKQIRKIIKQTRQKSAENRKPSVQTTCNQKPASREKYSSKNEDQSPRQGRFEGEFKDKLVKLVKILEFQKKDFKIQKRSIFQNRRQSDYQSKKQSSDLQYLTECLTSKLKCKTGYQLVGDMVRNNMHINRQVNKYLSQIKGVAQFLATEPNIDNKQAPIKDQHMEMPKSDTLSIYTF